MNLFLRTMFKLRQGPVQFLGLFLATEQEEFFLKRPRIWNHWFLFLGRELYQANDWGTPSRSLTVPLLAPFLLAAGVSPCAAFFLWPCGTG